MTQVRPRRDGEDVLEYVKAELLRHYEENPTHGAGCACTDELSRQLRVAARLIPAGQWSFQPEHVQKADHTLAALLHRLWRG